MLFTTAVTQKGQVTLPKKLREKAGIVPYDQVHVLYEKGLITIKPAEDILDVAGKIKIKKHTSVLKARDAFEKNYKRI